jgi:hypothetical protein
MIAIAGVVVDVDAACAVAECRACANALLARYRVRMRSLPSWLCLAVVFVLVVGTGCGRAHLYYETTELRHPAFARDQQAGLAQALADRIDDDVSIVWVDERRREQRLRGTPADLKKLGLAELGALWLALQGAERGAEADLRVRTGREKTPISVYWSLDGDLRIESGINEEAEEPAPSESEIRARFGLASALPGRWEEPERRALADALAVLSPRELEIVRDIPFDREAGVPGGDPTKAALYVQNGCKAKIYLYATGVKSDRFRFMGSARAPKSAVLHALVHEIGHAVSSAPSREKYCAAERDPKRRNALVAAGNDLVAGGPVIEAYLRVLDGLPAPTDYGNTSALESFAESFALFHIDEAALQRTRPAVARWFAKAGHEAALR